MEIVAKMSILCLGGDRFESVPHRHRGLLETLKMEPSPTLSGVLLQ